MSTLTADSLTDTRTAATPVTLDRAALLAEAAGTFGFCFAASAAIVMNHLTQSSLGLVGIGLAHGLAFAALAGSAACNPAITLARWVAGQLPPRAALVQIAAQVVGGLGA